MKHATFKAERGFTLIEMMVVIAIIALLASILFGSYAIYMEKARISAMFHNGYEIRRTLFLFYNDNSRFPKDRDEAIAVLREKLQPYNLAYPWLHTTILDDRVYTKSCYKPIPAGSDLPTDYVWLWPLPKRTLTEQAAKAFFSIVKEVPYDTNCPNAPEGTKYFVAITSTQVLIVAEEE